MTRRPFDGIVDWRFPIHQDLATEYKTTGADSVLALHPSMSLPPPHTEGDCRTRPDATSGSESGPSDPEGGAALENTPDAPESSPPHSPFFEFAFFTGFETGLAILALIIGWCFRFDARHDMIWVSGESDWSREFGIGLVGTLPIFAFMAWIEVSSWKECVRIRGYLESLIAKSFASLGIWQLAIISLAAAVGEEMLFRGAFQFLFTRWMPVGLAIAITSVLFGLAHAVTWGYAVAATLVGAYLGWLFVATDSLVPPMIAHAVYNTCALAYLCRKANRRE